MNEQDMLQNHAASIRYLVNLLCKKACRYDNHSNYHRLVRFKFFKHDNPSFFAVEERNIFAPRQYIDKIKQLREKARKWIVRHEVIVRKIHDDKYG